MLGGKRSRRPGRRRASVRLRHAALLLVVHRRARAVQRRWAVRDLRGHREAAASARARGSVGIAIGVLLVRDRARVVLVAHRAAREPSTSARRAESMLAVRPPHEDPRAPGRAARGHRRADRPRVRAGRRRRWPSVTDEPRWDAAGSLAIGMLLVVIAIVLADRDGEPARRRGGGARGRRQDPRRDRESSVRRAAHPPAHRARRSRRHRGRDQARVRPRLTVERARRRDRRGRSARPRRGPDHPPHLHRTRRLPRLTPGFGDIWRPFRSPIVARTCVQAGMSSGRRVLRSAVVAPGASASRVA